MLRKNIISAIMAIVVIVSSAVSTNQALPHARAAERSVTTSTPYRTEFLWFNWGKKKVSRRSSKKKASKKKASYTKEDYHLLAHVINAEAGKEYSYEKVTNMLQLYVGQVVLNRKKCHYRGAKTIKDVIYSPGQYSCVHDQSWDNKITKRAYKNAKILLSGRKYWNKYDIPKMPDKVIYQSRYLQGSRVWLNVSEFGDVYNFCYE